jgi:energy-coupling factor transport system ATP-binding protein
LIEVQDVCLTYQGAEAPALSDVNLTVQSGESVAIAGASGSGKTTLLRLLNGLRLPTSGRVVVDGMDTANEQQVWEIRRRVGYIFQNPDNQLVSTTVEREIAFGMENLGLDRTEMRERIEDTLSRLSLESLRDRPPHHLSGGEKQRVAVAAVLAMQPAYLLLDEPTSLLDALGRREVWSIIAGLAEDSSCAVVHVTQFPEEVALAKRVLVLEAGRLVFDGCPLDLFGSASDLRRWGLMRPPAMAIADKLRADGIAVPESVATLDELALAVSGDDDRERGASA